MAGTTSTAIRPYGIDTDFPHLWEISKEVDRKDKLGFSVSAQDREIESALHELWLARSNSYEQQVRDLVAAGQYVPTMYGIEHKNEHLTRNALDTR